jgi:hypothetical protein
MAAISVPDGRKVPNYALVANAALNADPQFPFLAYPANGYFALDPEVITGSDYEAGAVEVVIEALDNWSENDGTGWQVLIGAIPAENVLIFATHLAYHANGLTLPSTDSVEYSINFVQGKKYRFGFYAGDATSFGVDIYEEDSGHYVGGGSLSALATRVGNPVVHLGYPTDAQLGSYVDAEGYPVTAANGMKIISVSRIALPTALSLYPVAVETEKAGARRAVARFVVAHAKEIDGFQFAFVDGGADNTLFTIAGDQLFTVNQLTEGVKSVLVRVTDRFGRELDAPLVLGVGPQSGPTLLSIDNTTVEASQGEIEVGTFTTTDTTPGDIFTYALVMGEYSGQNDMFEIRGDKLYKITDTSAISTAWCRVRSTDALGQYIEQAFAIYTQDTVIPVVSTFTIDDGTSYDVSISSFTATDGDGTGVAAFWVGMTGTTPPAYPDPEWVLAAPTTFTIPLGSQTGTGDYTLDAYVIDGGGNLSVVATDTATLTIA